MNIAADSSVLVALLDPRDLWRDQSLALERALMEAGMAPVYFDCVAAEAMSAASRRLQEKGRAADVSALVDRLNERVPRGNLTWILSISARRAVLLRPGTRYDAGIIR